MMAIIAISGLITISNTEADKVSNVRLKIEYIPMNINHLSFRISMKSS